MTRALPPYLWMLLGLALGGCGWQPPGAGLGAGPGKLNVHVPLPMPHPRIAALEVAPFDVPEFGISGEYPVTWRLPAATPDANSVFQMRLGDDTYFNVGVLPLMRQMVIEAVPELPEAQASNTVLEHAVQGVVLADNYFLGTRKTVLNYSRVLFGDQEVLTVTQLIRRPPGLIEQMSAEEIENMRLMQQHYLELAPEGSRRLARHYVWLIGDDIWIAQVIAPPETFLQRSMEIEERLLPSLRFAAPSSDSKGA